MWKLNLNEVDKSCGFKVLKYVMPLGFQFSISLIPWEMFLLLYRFFSLVDFCLEEDKMLFCLEGMNYKHGKGLFYFVVA